MTITMTSYTKNISTSSIYADYQFLMAGTDTSGGHGDFYNRMQDVINNGVNVNVVVVDGTTGPWAQYQASEQAALGSVGLGASSDPAALCFTRATVNSDGSTVLTVVISSQFLQDAWYTSGGMDPVAATLQSALAHELGTNVWNYVTTGSLTENIFGNEDNKIMTQADPNYIPDTMTHVNPATGMRLASSLGPLRQFNLAHPKSLIL